MCIRDREETGQTERLPVEPDAMFSLGFPARPQSDQLAHFFFEADRGTMTATDMLKKLRAYFHFIKRQQRHKEGFGIHPVRAVLIETTNEARARRLMELVNHPLVCGVNKRAGLFWFSISSLFAYMAKDIETRHPLPHYLDTPEICMDVIWALPDMTMHSLADAEN